MFTVLLLEPVHLEEDFAITTVFVFFFWQTVQLLL